MAFSIGISLLFLCVIVAMASTTTGTTNATRIQEACSHTSHPDFCVSSLLSDPVAPTAEPYRLPGIAIRLAANNAEGASVHASALLMEGPSSASGGRDQCLRNCEQKLADAASQLEDCTAALDEKDYVTVRRLVEAAAADVACCNSGCKSAAALAATSMAEKSEELLKLCDTALALTKLVST